jgi:hypothetical protein
MSVMYKCNYQTAIRDLKYMYNFKFLLVSRYSDWLRAGRPRGESSSPGRVKNFLFSTSSRPALGSTQHSIQWVPGAFSPGVKGQGREAQNSPPTSAEVKKNVDLYFHIRLHDVVLNLLNTGTN